VAVHELALTPETVRGYFSADFPPVLSVEPRDSVRFRALCSNWWWERGGERFPRDGRHALTGPVEVRGARAGHTLAVSVDEVAPRDWGVTFAEGEPLFWELDGAVARSAHGEVQTAPFLGVIGMPPPEPGLHSTVPPRRSGGNVDCRLLVAGTTLYVPIPVDGALLMLGDGHAAQGDGEVSGTAIECPLEAAQVTLELRDDLDLRMPLARTADAWVAFGFDEELDRAAELALETMLDLMERELDVGRRDALALASVAVDLHVTQVVNEAKGVHAVLRDGAIRS
jgi:acetamidase/formamidase